MNTNKLKRYIRRIEDNMKDINRLTDRVDILSITDIAKENLKKY